MAFHKPINLYFYTRQDHSWRVTLDKSKQTSITTMPDHKKNNFKETVEEIAHISTIPILSLHINKAVNDFINKSYVW